MFHLQSFHSIIIPIKPCQISMRCKSLLDKMLQRPLLNTFMLCGQVPTTSLHQVFSTLLISAPLYTCPLCGITFSIKYYQFFKTYDEYQFLPKIFLDSSSKKLNSRNTLLLTLFSILPSVTVFVYASSHSPLYNSWESVVCLHYCTSQSAFSILYSC